MACAKLRSARMGVDNRPQTRKLPIDSAHGVPSKQYIEPIEQYDYGALKKNSPSCFLWIVAVCGEVLDRVCCC